MYAVYNDGMFTYGERQHPDFGLFSFAWPKKEFEAMSGVDASPYAQVSYEPDNNQLVVVEEATPGEVLLFSDPSEHPALDWIHNHIDLIRGKAEVDHAKIIGYAYNANTGRYVPQLELLSITEIKAALIQDIRVIAFSYASTILTISKIGDLTALDINTQVNNRLQMIRDWMNDQEDIVNAMALKPDLLAYRVPELDAQRESDINLVMGML